MKLIVFGIHLRYWWRNIKSDSTRIEKKYDNKEHPEDIFLIHEEFLKLSEAEQEEFCKAYGRDEVGMQYITAIEMKKKGTWDAYVKRWAQNKNKSSEDILREYIQERGLSFPRRVEL